MKNKILLMVLLFVAAGCIQEEIKETKHFRAAVEGVEMTKTSLGERNTVLWSKSDLVAVFADNQNPGMYQVSAESDGEQKADLVCKEAAPDGSSIGANVAVYPYMAGLKCSSRATDAYLVEGIAIPQVQKYSEGTFAKEAFIMAAASAADQNNLTFKNACGLLKLQLKGDITVKSIHLKGNAMEYLSGPAEVIVYNDVRTPSITMLTDEASEEVVLDCGEGVSLNPDSPVPFYIVLPPVAFESGFQVTVYDSHGGKKILNTSKANRVRRSGILTMPEVVVNEEDMDVPVNAEIQILNNSFDDVRIKVSVTGAVEYTGGYKLKEDYNVTNVLREANWKTSPRISDNFTYEGPMDAFPTGTSAGMIPGRKYVIWVAAYGRNTNALKAEDLVTAEVEVPALTSGGALKPEVSDVRSGFDFVELDLRADGASLVFASLLTAKEVRSYNTDEKKLSYLLTKTVPVSGSQATLSRDNLASGETLTLLAMAVDAQGCYGEVLEASYVPESPEFDEDAALSVDITCDGKTARIRPSVSKDGFDEYYYYVDKSVASAWSRVFGGSLASAESYITVHNDQYPIRNTVDEPMVDGCIVLDNLEIETEYKILVIARKSDGTFTRASMTTFTSHIDLGNMIYKTGETRTLWYSTVPTVTFGTCAKDGEFAIINWSVTPAEGMRAYTACLTTGIITADDTKEMIVIKIINNGVEVVPDKMETMLYGDDTSAVYVTWCDEDGNFFEPAIFEVP